MTQYMMAVYGDETELAAIPPAEMQQMYVDVEVVNQKLRQAGAWVYGNGLERSSTATVVRVQASGDVLMTDGPFLETKEHLGGFWIIEAADLDAALAWAREATVACRGPVEVRPFQDTPGV